MKIKTAELIGLPLDWAVAVCEGKENYFEIREGQIWYERASGDLIRYSPSTKFMQGGRTIDRAQIQVIKGNPLYFPNGNDTGDYYEPLWIAGKMHGQTRLIAGLRCYVASQLGDEVEVPDYLLTA
jgi:hypothetical protein